MNKEKSNRKKRFILILFSFVVSSYLWVIVISTKNELLWVKIKKSAFATPIFVKKYADLVPKFQTPIKNVYIGGTLNTYPYSRNVNSGIRIGKQIANLIKSRTGNM